MSASRVQICSKQLLVMTDPACRTQIFCKAGPILLLQSSPAPKDPYDYAIRFTRVNKKLCYYVTFCSFDHPETQLRQIRGMRHFAPSITELSPARALTRQWQVICVAPSFHGRWRAMSQHASQASPLAADQEGANVPDQQMQKSTQMANAIRALSMDAVQAANSGHPGIWARRRH